HSRKAYPYTPLRLYVETLGAVIKPVLDRKCSIGVIGPLPIVPDERQTEHLLDLTMVTVVSPTHPLAGKRTAVSTAAVAQKIQLGVTDRCGFTDGRGFG